MDALTRLQRDLDDPKLIAFAGAMARSEQLLTGALMVEDRDLYERLLGEAKAIGEEWGFHEDLRFAILEAAYENAYMGRTI